MKFERYKKMTPSTKPLIRGTKALPGNIPPCEPVPGISGNKDKIDKLFRSR